MAEFTTIISAEELHANLGLPGWIVVDCRFTLADPAAGRRAYDEGHIEGARYADLDHDLSSPVIRGKTGRHPLPPIASVAATLGQWGIDAASQVIAYDASNSSMAARLWWILRWLGHERVAVLDGGWQAWTARGFPVTTALPRATSRTFVPHVRDIALDAEEIERVRADPAWRVLDARAADRFRGENETIDPVAGHIPGARSAPWGENVTADGRFKPAPELRARFSVLLGPTPVERVACYCGSGVTAAHDVLAIEHAGLGTVKLYTGSWSDWINDPRRPVATGAE